MNRKRRNVLALLILVVWVGVVAWFVKREYFQPLSARLAEASANLVPSASFYSVKLGDATIGFAASRIDTLPDGFVLADDMRLRITALGTEVPSSVRTDVRLGERLDLQGFEFSLRSSLGDFRVKGEMEGDSTLRLDLATGDDEQSLAVPTRGPVLLPQVMPIHFALGGEPEPGESYV